MKRFILYTFSILSLGVGSHPSIAQDSPAPEPSIANQSPATTKPTDISGSEPFVRLDSESRYLARLLSSHTVARDPAEMNTYLLESLRTNQINFRKAQSELTELKLRLDLANRKLETKDTSRRAQDPKSEAMLVEFAQQLEILRDTLYERDKTLGLAESRVSELEAWFRSMKVVENDAHPHQDLTKARAELSRTQQEKADLQASLAQLSTSVASIKGQNQSLTNELSSLRAKPPVESTDIVIRQRLQTLEKQNQMLTQSAKESQDGIKQATKIRGLNRQLAVAHAEITRITRINAARKEQATTTEASSNRIAALQQSNADLKQQLQIAGETNQGHAAAQQQNELNTAQLNTANRQVSQLQAQALADRRTREEHEAQIKELNAKLEASQAPNANFEKKIATLQKSNADLKGQLEAAAQQPHASSTQLTTSNQQISRLKAQLAALEAIKGERETLTNRLSTMQAKSKSSELLHQQLQLALENTAKKATSESQSSAATIQGLSSELETMRAEIAAAPKPSDANHRRQVVALQKSNALLKNQLTDLKIKLQQVESKSATGQARIAEQGELYAATLKQKQQATSQLTSANQQVSSLQKQLETKTQAEVKVQAELVGLTNQIEQLKSANNELAQKQQAQSESKAQKLQAMLLGKQTLQSELFSIKSSLQSHNSEMASLKQVKQAKINAIKKKYDSLKTELTSVKNELAIKNDTLSIAESKLDKLETVEANNVLYKTDLAALKDELTLKTEKLSATESDLVILKAAEDESNTLKAELGEVKTTLAAKTSALTEAETRLAEFKVDSQTHLALETELDEVKTTLATKTDALTEAEARLAEFKVDRETHLALEAELGEVKTTLAQAEASLAEFTTDSETHLPLQTELDEVKTTLAARTDALAQAEASLAEFTTDSEAHLTLQTELDETKTALATKIDDLAAVEIELAAFKADEQNSVALNAKLTELQTDFTARNQELTTQLATVDQLRSAKVEAENQLVTANSTIEQLEAAKTLETEKLEQLNQDLELATQSNQERLGTIETLRAQITAKEKAITALTKQKSTIEKEGQILMSNFTTRGSELASLTKLLTTTTGESKSLKLRTTELTEQLQTSQAEVQRLGKEGESIRSQLEQQAKEQNIHVLELTDQLTALRQKRDGLDKDLKDLKQVQLEMITESADKLDTAFEREQTLAQQLDKSQSQIDDLSDQINLLQTDLKETRHHAAELNKAHSKEQTKAKELSVELQEKTAITDAAREVLYRIQPVYFGYNQKSFDSAQQAIVFNQVDYITRIFPEAKFLVTGHTDDVGSDQSNLTLSESRARNFANYLIENGIPEKQVTFEGLGESRPIADNNTYEGKAKNRRVEVEVVR